MVLIARLVWKPMSTDKQLSNGFTGRVVFSESKGKWGYEVRKDNGNTHVSDFIFDTSELAEYEMNELLNLVEGRQLPKI